MLIQKQLSAVLIIIILVISNNYLLAQKRAVLFPSNNRSCIYLEDPVYIINASNVIYQHCNTRKILHPDIASFRAIRWSDAARFALDKNGVYFEGKLIKADTTGFILVGISSYDHFIWKNKNQVFDNQTELKSVDAPSFFNILNSLNSSYFKDKNSVYYLNRRIPIADVQSFDISPFGRVYDKNWVYHADTILTYHGKKLHSVNQTLAKTDDEVIYLPQMTTVKGIDAKSLKGLSSSYSADHNYIFYDTIIIKGAGHSLDSIKAWEQVNSVILADGHHVYLRETPFETELDGPSFHVLNYSDLFYDKNGIYYRGWDDKSKRATAVKYPFNYTVPSTPENTFLSKNGLFLIYNGQVYSLMQNKTLNSLSNGEIEKFKSMAARYFPGSILLDVVRGNVRFLDNDLVADGPRLFYKDSLISNIDARFLSHIGNGYYKYKHKVYIFSRVTFVPIPGADVATFKSNGRMTYDKGNVYYGGRPIIKSNGVELLAIFAGPRVGGDEGMYITDYYLYHNKQGYWIKPTGNSPVKFGGRSIDPKIITLPKGFELHDARIK